MSPYSERKTRENKPGNSLPQSSEGQSSSPILPKQGWILEEAREVCCGHLGMSGKGQNEGTLREGKREFR